MLKQSLRCLTVPQPHEYQRMIVDTMLRTLQSFATAILSRTSKPGEPCGDTLRAICNEKDEICNDISPQSFNRFVSIVSLLDSLESAVCGHCGKSGPLDKVCFQCHMMSYCLRACQKADWKQH